MNGITLFNLPVAVFSVGMMIISFTSNLPIIAIIFGVFAALSSLFVLDDLRFNERITMWLLGVSEEDVARELASQG